MRPTTSSPTGVLPKFREEDENRAPHKAIKLPNKGKCTHWHKRACVAHETQDARQDATRWVDDGLEFSANWVDMSSVTNAGRLVDTGGCYCFGDDCGGTSEYAHCLVLVRALTVEWDATAGVDRYEDRNVMDPYVSSCALERGGFVHQYGFATLGAARWRDDDPMIYAPRYHYYDVCSKYRAAAQKSRHRNGATLLWQWREWEEGQFLPVNSDEEAHFIVRVKATTDGHTTEKLRFLFHDDDTTLEGRPADEGLGGCEFSFNGLNRRTIVGTAAPFSNVGACADRRCHPLKCTLHVDWMKATPVTVSG